MRTLPTLLLALCTAAPVTPRAQEVLDVGPRTGAAPEPFSAITGLIALRDGRTLVTDARERRIWLVDPRAETAVEVSREGDGPREFRSAGPLFNWAGDSVAMYDSRASRVLVFDPNGQPRRSFVLATTLGPAAAVLRSNDVRFIDRRGVVYAQDGSVPVVDAPGASAPDSAPLLRIDPATKRVDTVSLVRLSGLTQRREAGGTTIDLGRAANPYRVRDAWALSSDGRIGILRSDPYRLDWIGPGRRVVRGPIVRLAPIRVVDADREAISREGIAFGNQVMPIPVDQLTDLPATKPAFDHRTLVADRSGRFWVQRFRAAADSVPIYDVFDADGVLATRVRVPTGTRVVGFGVDAVFLARTDEDGLSWLERRSWR